MAVVTGTNSNDVLTFQGSLQQVTGVFVNPYDGLTVSLNDIYNVNQATYDGLAGTDLLSMSPYGDFLTLNDGSGNATVTNVERFVAGTGNDALFFSDATLTMGDTLISGGEGNDVIWANVGNDIVTGGDSNDLIDGGPGNDTINGENGNDTLYGWTGNDTLSGGAGDDILYGGPGNDVLLGGDGNDTLYGDNGPNSNPADYTHTQTLSHSFTGAVYAVAMDHTVNVYVPPGNQAVTADNVSINYATTVSATFVFSEAGYADSFGLYRISADGSIHDVNILMKNQHQTAEGTQFTYSYNGQQGDTLGMFIVANGYNTSAAFRNADLTHGTLQFIYDFGLGDQRTANVNDDGHHVTLVYNDGVHDTAFNVNTYHSSLSGGASTLNQDGIPHVVSGLADASDPSTLRVAFEDLYYLGDADFNDVIFDIHVANQVTQILGASDNDYLAGGNGNDILYGGFGNDILVGGVGTDQLYGGTGADIFAFDTLDNNPDVIHDFKASEGDSINLTNLLVGFDPLTSAIQDFIHLVHNGPDDNLAVNANGAPGGTYQVQAIILGGTGMDVNTMLADGSLVVDHNVVV